jgi:hypothetical protein
VFTDYAALAPEQRNILRPTFLNPPRTRRSTESGLVEVEYSAFAVDGRPDLEMVICNPVTEQDADNTRALINK